jgi:hypothetical protein
MDDFDRLLDHWRRVVDHAAGELSTVDEGDARRRPAPGKWSIKEIVGHLIDSASNNHKRFVEAQERIEPVTLAYFVRDYVGHLEHHLAQIRALLPRREVL